MYHGIVIAPVVSGFDLVASARVRLAYLSRMGWASDGTTRVTFSLVSNNIIMLFRE